MWVQLCMGKSRLPKPKMVIIIYKKNLTNIYLNEWYQNLEMDKCDPRFKKSF